MHFVFKTQVIALLLFSSASLHAEAALYTTEGRDQTIEELVKSGSIVPGERMGKGPVLGSKVIVNTEELEKLTGKLGPLDKKHIVGIQHPAGHGSRGNLDRWSRWYQEDGNTQIFRMMKGEQSFRSGIGENSKPGRVESYSNGLVVEPGTWREWEGTYTIIQPHGGSIFQLFHEGGQLWAFQLTMNSEGDIIFHRRRKAANQESLITLGEKMVGKPLSVKIRANGNDFEIYKKRPLQDNDWVLVTKGSYLKAEENRIQFRWGMYMGQKKGASQNNDTMLFVSGTTIR